MARAPPIQGKAAPAIAPRPAAPPAAPAAAPEAPSDAEKVVVAMALAADVPMVVPSEAASPEPIAVGKPPTMPAAKFCRADEPSFSPTQPMALETLPVSPPLTAEYMLLALLAMPRTPPPCCGLL